MLTEAYTSLLAALTVWDPAERHADTLDQHRQARGTRGRTKRYSGVTDSKEVAQTNSPDRWVKKQVRTGGLTDKEISQKGRTQKSRDMNKYNNERDWCVDRHCDLDCHRHGQTERRGPTVREEKSAGRVRCC